MTDFVYRPGDVVESRQGRDRGRLMFVMSVQDGLLTLCDGRMRRTERPKRKKPKHVRYVGGINDNPPDGGPADCLTKTAEKLRTGGPVTNNELRRALNAFADTGSGNDGFNGRRDADVKG